MISGGEFDVSRAVSSTIRDLIDLVRRRHGAKPVVRDIVSCPGTAAINFGNCIHDALPPVRDGKCAAFVTIVYTQSRARVINVVPPTFTSVRINARKYPPKRTLLRSGVKAKLFSETFGVLCLTRHTDGNGPVWGISFSFLNFFFWPVCGAPGRTVRAR